MCCGVEKGYDGTKLVGWAEGTCGEIFLHFSLVWVHKSYKNCIPAHTSSCEYEGSAIYFQRFDNHINILEKIIKNENAESMNIYHHHARPI